MDKTWTIIGAGLLLAATPVLAQERANNDGFYFGAGVGELSTEIDENLQSPLWPVKQIERFRGLG